MDGPPSVSKHDPQPELPMQLATSSLYSGDGNNGRITISARVKVYDVKPSAAINYNRSFTNTYLKISLSLAKLQKSYLPRIDKKRSISSLLFRRGLISQGFFPSVLFFFSILLEALAL